MSGLLNRMGGTSSIFNPQQVLALQAVPFDIAF
jgi:hypothetical protein